MEHAFFVAEKALENNDSKEYSKHNQAFHMEIWAAADNEKMKSLFEHRQILDAVKANDGELARKRMQDHIIRSMNNILTRFEEK